MLDRYPEIHGHFTQIVKLMSSCVMHFTQMQMDAVCKQLKTCRLHIWYRWLAASIFNLGPALRKGPSSEPVAHFCLKKSLKAELLSGSQHAFLSFYCCQDLRYHWPITWNAVHFWDASCLPPTAPAITASNKVNKPLNCLHGHTAHPPALNHLTLLWLYVGRR